MSNFSSLKKGLEKHINKEFHNLIRTSEASEQIVVSTHLSTDCTDQVLRSREEEYYSLCLPKNLFTKRSLIKYAILSWFLPPLTQFELQEILRSKARAQHYIEIESYIYSYELCALAIYLETDYSQNDVFGNILQEGNMVNGFDLSGKKKKVNSRDYCFLNLNRKSRIRRPQRKRGYNDHGSSASLQTKVIKKLNQEYGSQKSYQRELELTSYHLQTENRILMLLSILESV